MKLSSRNNNIKINNDGVLEIAGIDVVSLRKKYGTPLYVMDYGYIEQICKEYVEILSSDYGDGLVCYASKAFSCKAIYDIVGKFGLGADVVSGGELYTAINAGMPTNKIIFHGNNKLPSELELAVSNNVYAIVVDSLEEIELLGNVVKKLHARPQKVFIRTNPGIDAHTHHFIQTSRVDSKFGFSMTDGMAIEAIAKILANANLEFVGIHCHIGSQIFELKPFKLAVEKMTDFILEIKKKLGADVKELNMGGGFGIVYTKEDKPLSPSEYVKTIISALKECLIQKNIVQPRLIIEPGRSIVGEAGVTLYTVGAIKDIKDIKKYVMVDGGMFDNPRYALYEAQYDAVVANKMHIPATEKVTIAGKCCESGDVLAVDVMVSPCVSGDIVAVFSTGAYNYSMASNYNRNLIPPVVLIKGGKSDYIVKPQTYDDLIARDNLPEFLD